MSQVCTENFSPLLHQVAGCHSGIPSNILINRTGQIFKPYKPVSNPTYNSKEEEKPQRDDLVPITLNELQFYTELNQSNDPDFAALKALAPKYFGSTRIGDIDHLILEDFTQGMKYPCVMDIKLGKDRYYPGRLMTKSSQDSIKYPCLQEYGFCLAGMKLCNSITGEVELHYLPKTTHHFSSEEVKKHIKMFLRVDDDDGTLRKNLLEGAEAILRWSANQRSFIFRGSSILFVYDSAVCDVTTGEPNSNLRARVGMIDFAHIFHSFGSRDDNYYNGIKNLIDLIRSFQD